MNYFKIGEKLKLIREKKGLSYEQIYEITRIQPRILKAIEEGETPVAGVILNEFIRNYARALGVEVESFSTQKEEEEDREEKDSSFESPPLEKISYPVKKYLLFFAGAVFFIVSFLLFGVFTRESKETKVDLSQAQEKSVESKEPPVPETVKQKEKPLPSKELSLFDQIKSSAFKKEILIQSSENLKIYFKTDRGGTITKNLSPSVWLKIKAQNSIYLRFDEPLGEIKIFYNGQQISVDQNSFFERSF